MIDIVILAAGQGKRMGADIPKPFRTIHGKSFLARIVDTCTSLVHTKRIYIVVNHAIHNRVREAFPECTILIQSPEKGTAKALQAYVDGVPSQDRSPRVLVLPADIPMIPRRHLQRFLDNVYDGNGIVVFRPSEDAMYGRVISNCDGTIQIVEATDCGAHHATVPLRNTGVYLFTQATLAFLPSIGNDNVQQEHYLTDIFQVSDAHVRMFKVPSHDNLYFYGVNTMEELATLERSVGVRENAQE